MNVLTSGDRISSPIFGNGADFLIRFFNLVVYTRIVLSKCSSSILLIWFRHVQYMFREVKIFLTPNISAYMQYIISVGTGN